MERGNKGGGRAAEPPVLAQVMLRALVRPEDRETILGDLLEEYRSRAVARGWAQAKAEYWREVVASAPHFLIHRIERALTGRNQDMDTRSGVRQALFGLLFAMPALLLVVGGVLQSTGVLADDLAGSVGGPASGVLRTLQHPVLI
ncbi:MAG: permease prefix domain 2-containing transporter, partial [Anaerolineales bacterium]